MADVGIGIDAKDNTARGVNSAERRFKGLGGVIKTAVGAAAGLAAFGVAAKGIGAVTSAFSGFLTTGDKLDKMSSKLGINIETLSAWSFAAEQSGTSIDTVEKAVLKNSKTLTAAADGNKKARDTYASLGLEWDKLAALSPEDQFREIQKAIAAIEDPTKRAALAQEVFGKSGAELLPLVGNLAALEKQAIATGNVMSEDTAKNAAMFNDALNTVKNQVSGVLLKGFAAALPVMIAVADFIANTLAPAFSKIVAPAIEAVGRIWKEQLQPTFEAFVPVIEFVAKVWTDNFDAIALVTTTVFRLIAERIELVVETIRNVLTIALALIRGDWDGAWNGVKQIFIDVWDSIETSFKLVTGLVTGLMDIFGVDLLKGVKAIVNGMIGLVEHIPNAWISAFNSIILAWNGLSFGIPGFDPPGPGPKFPGVTVSTPNVSTFPSVSIPRLARGGIVTRPTLALIGEAGPEAIVPLSGGRGGNTYIINTPALLGDERAIRRFILRVVNDRDAQLAGV